jgi:thymidylate synthase (FAD)
VDVSLIRITPDPEKVIAKSARLCYASEARSEDADSELVKKLRDWKHFSTFEHACATFLIDGVSRALTHQLVRHRIASYSQQSQRYVNEGGFKYVIPPKIESDDNAKKKYVECIEDVRRTYDELIGMGVAREDARFVLPNACETKIMVTMNFRELRHFISLRSEKGAQWEIRDLAQNMLKILRKEAPNAFDDL